MTSEPKPSALQPANQAARRNAKILFGFFALCAALLLAASLRSEPFVAGAFGAGHQSAARKIAQPMLPFVPAGNKMGLPYEAIPIFPRKPDATGGPDAYGYIYDDNTEPNGPTYTWQIGVNRIADTAWQRVLTSGDAWDDGVVTTTLPFSFNLYGTNYTQMFISTNGNVNFVTPNDAYPRWSEYACLPRVDPHVPRPMIAPDWFDFVIPTGSNPSGGVYTIALGTSPNRQYVVEWRNAHKFQDENTRATLELVLYESGEFRFQYNALQGVGVSGGEGAIGVQNENATIALQYTCRAEAVIPNRVIRYRLQQAAIFTTNNPERGGAPGATIVFTPTLTNQTGQDNIFDISYVHANETWTTTVAPTVTNILQNGASTIVEARVQIPPRSPVGSRDVATLTVTSRLPAPGTYTATLVLTTTVSNNGVAFSQPDQIQSGAYSSTVTYLSQLANASPSTNDFFLSTSDSIWDTQITPGEIDNLPPNASSPFTVTVRVPRDTSLGAYDAITVTASDGLTEPTYYGATVFTTTAGVWDPKTPMPLSRSRGAAVLFPSNRHVYALGGETYGGNNNLPIEEYSPLADAWTTRTRLLYGVSNVAGAVITDSTGVGIYIPGGYSASLGGALNVLQVYYPQLERVAVISTDPLPVPRMGAGVAAHNNRLYVIGGADNSLQGTSTVYEYDPNRPEGNRWRAKTPMRNPRVYLAAATLGNYIYAVGGMPGATVEMREVEAYNPGNDSWSPRSPMSRGRAGLALVAANSGEPGCGGYMYALGGGWFNYTASGERFDPSTGFLGSWSPLSSLTSARRSLAAAYSPSTRALVAFGGWSSQYEITNEAARCSGQFLPPAPCPVPFTDVFPTDYFYEAVRYLYCAGIISGYADNTFRPGNSTTRGQLCKIVTLAQGWPIDTSGGPHFSDVPPDHPFYGYVETAYHHNVISGYADGTFRWGNSVTRAQLCKVIMLAKGWPIDTSGGPHFSDVPTTDTFYGYVETAYHREIISGYADGTFRPGNLATRGQISKIVFQAIIQP